MSGGGMRASALAAAWLIALGVAGCRPAPRNDATSDAAAESSSAVAAADASRPSTAIPREAGPPPRGCRVLGVSGKLAYEKSDAAPPPLAMGTALTGLSWVELDPGAVLQSKDVRTGRELSFAGPGAAVPCKDREADEAWLARGTFTSSPGTGEAPGQEQWVVTRLGVLRYAAARLEVKSDGDSADARISQGAAWAYRATDAREDGDGGGAEPVEGWSRLDAGTRLRWTLPRTPAKTSAESALGACEKFATQTQAGARAIAAEDGGAALGLLAVHHMTARSRARAACAVAAIRLALAPRDAHLPARLDAAERALHEVPGAEGTDAGP